MIQKYSLFQIEQIIEEQPTFQMGRKCFIYLDTFYSLAEAQDNANHIKENTLILASY